MTRYAYNRQVSPPAPFVHVTVSEPDQRASVDNIPAQVDTAADMTVLPQSLVDTLGLVQLDRVPATGFGGHVSFVPSYIVRVEIRGLSSAVVKVLASRDEPYVLLGRDVLNRHRMVLDGPRLTLEML